MGQWILISCLVYGRLQSWVTIRKHPPNLKKDAFAVCLKAEVAKYSYKQKFPGEWGCLCGIMWGIDSQKVIAAFNFTIDPFRNLILFDPVKGEKIDHAKYPSLDFCVL